MKLRFHTLDVFTSQRFAGNPLAVVLDADLLDTSAMQEIAREFNLSETVFVLKPRNPAHSARVRIFTPAIELPFAGHPTIGTAALLADLKAPDVERERDAIVLLEENIGSVRVGVRLKPDAAAFAEFDAPKLSEPAGEPPSTERLAAALGLLPSEIGFANHKPSQYSAGVPFTFVPVASLEAIARAEIVTSHWAAAFGSMKAGKVYLYCRQTVHNSSHLHARMFGPGGGVHEDPATGSAAAALAGVLTQFDAPPAGWHKRVIEQGYEMGRPSTILLSVEMERGRLKTVRIGGHAVRLASGELSI